MQRRIRVLLNVTAVITTIATVAAITGVSTANTVTQNDPVQTPTPDGQAAAESWCKQQLAASNTPGAKVAEAVDETTFRARINGPTETSLNGVAVKITPCSMTRKGPGPWTQSVLYSHQITVPVGQITRVSSCAPAYGYAAPQTAMAPGPIALIAGLDRCTDSRILDTRGSKSPAQEQVLTPTQHCATEGPQVLAIMSMYRVQRRNVTTLQPETPLESRHVAPKTC